MMIISALLLSQLDVVSGRIRGRGVITTADHSGEAPNMEKLKLKFPTMTADKWKPKDSDKICKTWIKAQLPGEDPFSFEKKTNPLLGEFKFTSEFDHSTSKKDRAWIHDYIDTPWYAAGYLKTATPNLIVSGGKDKKEGNYFAIANRYVYRDGVNWFMMDRPLNIPLVWKCPVSGIQWSDITFFEDGVWFMIRTGKKGKKKYGPIHSSFTQCEDTKGRRIGMVHTQVEGGKSNDYYYTKIK